MTRSNAQFPALLDDGPYGKLVFAITYGSQKNDCDVLAVYDPPPFGNEILLGSLDCLVLGRVDLEQLTLNLDPAVTEPLLSGRLLRGSGDVLRHFQDMLAISQPRTAAPRHLLRRCFSAYESAVVTLQRIRQSPTAPLSRLFWKNLAWSVSYFCFAAYYTQNQGRSVIGLTELIPAMSSETGEVWLRIQQNKLSSDIQVCVDSLVKWESCLMSNALLIDQG